MRTADYFAKVSKPWQKAKNRISFQRDKLSREIGIPNQESLEFKEAWKKRYAELLKKFSEWEWLFVRMLPGRPLMPDPARVLENEGKATKKTRTRRSTTETKK
jgi:hypothetical protein